MTQGFSREPNNTTVTIRDVAELAGVSITTVSHVINGTRFVSDELSQRVLHAMERLGYKPNMLARGLRSGQTKTIGLVVPDMSNLFFAEVSRAIEDIAFHNRYSLIICNSDDNPEKQKSYFDVLVTKQVDGIIFISTSGSDDFYERVLSLKIPIVFADREIPEVNVDTVMIDNEYGGYLATRYLIGLGHRRIACVTGPSALTPSAGRVAGYRHAMEEAGLAVQPEWIVNGDFHFQSGEAAMQQLLDLDPQPEAVFVSNDMMAFGAIRAARSRGLQLPRDMSIVGFDDITLAQASSPALTTVSQPIQEMAEKITELLFLHIQEKPQGAERVRIVLKPMLVIRDSCQPKGVELLAEP